MSRDPTVTNFFLDDFNRPDEGPPPGSNWFNYQEGWAQLKVTNGELCPVPDDTYGGATWNTQHGENSEVYVTVSHVQADAIGPDQTVFSLYLNNNQTDAPALYTSTGAYLITEYIEGSGFRCWIRALEPPAWFGPSDYFTLAEGDAFALRSLCGTLSAWRRPAGTTEWQKIIEHSGGVSPGYPAVWIDRGRDPNYEWQPLVHLDDFGGGIVVGIVAPTNLQAHIAGNEVTLTWKNQPPAYTYLTVERAISKDGPWSDLGEELSPTDETATDNSPGDFSAWYHVYVENDYGSATTPAVRAAEYVKQTWNQVAHKMGIPDLASPVAPFTTGEAGEQLFLVCCRLWHMAVAPDLPDPVLSDPADWRTFIETGAFPA